MSFLRGCRKNLKSFHQLIWAIASPWDRDRSDGPADYRNSTFQSLPAGLLDPPTQLTSQGVLFTGAPTPKSSRPLLKRTVGVEVHGFMTWCLFGPDL